MGFLDRIFGKKPAARVTGPVDEGEFADDDDDLRSTAAQRVHGPPEFVRAVALQRAYWTHNPDEHARLEARGIEQLGWRERLRLHHLNCLQRLDAGADRAAAAAKCAQTARRLVAPDSPYRPRVAMVWQGQSPDAGGAGGGREPDLRGEFLNPSLTHLGCLEFHRIDGSNEPGELDFVSFDELSAVMFAPPSLLRGARLFYDDGRDEIVCLPLLYGLTGAIGNEHDRAGSMTRFVAHVDDDDVGRAGASGMGVGQQDFAVRSADGASSLFGMGSVAEISFPLDMRDPRFDEKSRARGIDPDEVRRQIGRG